ncbi:MAG: restriction endonuclease subunit S [Chloroherpetonaceae bacterium]|nr:restriction endonuclease subunit S [Chloroherpetonaceae bacterium]
MSSYTISPTLNKSRVFILQKSELEKRWDPSWYIYLQSIQGFKDKKVPVKNLLLENPQYGANEIGIERLSNTEPRYIRITDINDFGELENVLGKTASVIEEKYFLNENDLLLARSGNTVGKSYLHKNVGYNCFFAGYMIRFKLDQTKVLPEYIFAYTQTEFYKKWIKAIQRTTGQPNINAEEYRSLEIPLPEKSTQDKIVKIYFDFIAQKQNNEAEADKLLSSIDDYLLKELGIKLPEPPKNTLKNRMFTRTLKEISNNRFDPFYHKEEFAVLDKILDNKMFIKFSTLIQVITKGETPLWKGESYVDSGIPFLKVQNISSDGIFGEITFITEELHKKMTRSILKGGELLYTMAGSIGIATYLPIDFGEANINQAIAKIILKDNLEIDKSFLLYIINSKICKKQAERFLTVSAQPNINFDQIKAIKVPVPPLDKQKEIVEHITGIRQQAQQLKDKTNELLKKASEEIEEILLN